MSNRTPQLQSNRRTIFLFFFSAIILKTCFTATAPYVCTYPQIYVEPTNINIFESKICAIATPSIAYRIAGGASVTCNNGALSLSQSDMNVLPQAICENINTGSGVKKVSGEALICPEGYRRATFTEGLAFSTELCDSLGTWDIVRIGEQGTMRGMGYDCEVREVDNAGVGDVLCVDANTYSFQLVNAGENVCGSCQSLYTTHEVLEDISGSNTLCSSISVGQTVRLAGGSSMTRTSLGCTIQMADNSALTDGLCGPSSTPYLFKGFYKDDPRFSDPHDDPPKYGSPKW